MRILGAVIGALMLGPILPASALADDAGSRGPESLFGLFNNGEDITRPVNLFQVRQRYGRLPDEKGLEPEKWTTTLRADLRTDLGADWTLYSRIDEPLVYADDVTSSFNPNGHSRFGQGDLLTEFAIITPTFATRLGVAAGIRAVWPTAGLNEAGNGKYQLGPGVAVRYSLPEISPGSYVVPEVIYLNSVASRDQNSERADINRLNIQPKLNIALPDDWFATAYASENILINYGDDGKFFIPFDLMVGKKLFDKWVASIEYSQEMLHSQGYEPYQWQFEGRLGVYF